jgi:hypothetical protein
MLAVVAALVGRGRSFPPPMPVLSPQPCVPTGAPGSITHRDEPAADGSLAATIANGH